jgi:hypothetical protein
LLDVDQRGLLDVITWLQAVVSSRRKAVLSDCPGCVAQSGVQVAVLRAVNDTGIRRAARTEFIWQRSEEGWTEVIDKLAAMETGACHRYLDGPRDDVRVVASIGEYGDAWWRRHGSRGRSSYDQVVER